MHTCPDCGQACYCGGDIDDIPCDEAAADACLHCDPFDDEHPENDEEKTTRG
jgi:hypothetical protein